MTKDMNNTSLLTQANDTKARQSAISAVGRSNIYVRVGLALSALLSVLYITLALSPVIGIPSPWSWAVGVFVGLMSVVPAELAMSIWMARLQGDLSITSNQKWVAIICLVLAGIAAAVTTTSFFAWALGGLFPSVWVDDVQPYANLGAILGAWVVFIIGIIGYHIAAINTQQNLEEAEAHNLLRQTQFDIIKAWAMATANEADNLVANMDNKRLFANDAMKMINAFMGDNDERANIVEGFVTKIQSNDAPRQEPQHATAVASQTAPQPARVEPAQREEVKPSEAVQFRYQ
jgi:hypothetical protein